MAIARRVERISVQEYLDGEEGSELRHEYVDGQVYAMVGSTVGHNTLALNLAIALNSAVLGSPCRVNVSDVKVRVDEVFYYPDILVSCGPLDPKARYVTDPVLIVEVLSESTEGRDRLEKRVAYLGLPSLQEYVLVEQDRIAVDVYRRLPDGWEVVSYGAGEDLELTSIGLTLPLDRLYADVLP